MKLIVRCILAIVAIVGCFALLRKVTPVQAQSFSDTCSTEENNCLSNGGSSDTCSAQYQNCMQTRQSECASNGGAPACTINYNDNGPSCVSSCNPSGGCPNPPPACPHPLCASSGPSYYWECDSPVVVDVQGLGFHFTSAANGVLFDFGGAGTKKQVAWTDPQYGNAWLVLDRNGNGQIDDATELFGNFTPQPDSPNPNGFLALGFFDAPANGGDGDGNITKADAIYPRLRLWIDSNHNGISEPGELKSLPSAGVERISLNYRDGKRTDQYGNTFRYRSHVRMASAANLDHLIYDVYLVGK